MNIVKFLLLILTKSRFLQDIVFILQNQKLSLKSTIESYDLICVVRLFTLEWPTTASVDFCDPELGTAVGPFQLSCQVQYFLVHLKICSNPPIDLNDDNRIVSDWEKIKPKPYIYPMRYHHCFWAPSFKINPNFVTDLQLHWINNAKNFRTEISNALENENDDNLK